MPSRTLARGRTAHSEVTAPFDQPMSETRCLIAQDWLCSQRRAALASATRSREERGETVGKQRRDAGGGQPFAPIGEASNDLAGAVDQAPAAMQRDHPGERPRALGPKQDTGQVGIAMRDSNLFDGAGRGRKRDGAGSEESDREAHAATSSESEPDF